MQLTANFTYCVCQLERHQAMQASPHALDFDWRFDTETVDEICAVLPREGKILALGAPTIAERLETERRGVTLIDRQPERGVSDHRQADIDFLTAPMSGFKAAIVDPPWYPEHLIRWTTFAASCVGPGGTILTSAWPANTRPGAEEQLEGALRCISQWASISRLPFEPTYQVPLFERRAAEVNEQGILARSPGKGVLLSISVIEPPGNMEPPPGRDLWHRFNIDDYQLALRLNGTNHSRPAVLRHPAAVGWQWPFVSARAAGRSSIDLWSSEGEVARLQSPQQVANILQSALSTRDVEQFNAALASLPELMDWRIPRPPYRSLFEWQHRQ